MSASKLDFVAQVLARTFIMERGSFLNALILKGHRPHAPANLRFDKVNKRLLSSDQIHPTSKGYAAPAKKFIRYLTVTLPPIMQALRPDADGNGITDLFE